MAFKNCCMPSIFFKKKNNSDYSISNKIENNLRPTAQITPDHNEREIMLNVNQNTRQFKIDENVINENRNDAG